MSKSNILPFNYNGVQLVVQQDENGDPLFEVNSLCDLLQYSNARDALSRHVSKDDVVKRDTIDNMGRVQKKNHVKERGMWKLLMKSNAPNAEPVQDWIAGDVLPSIRKTGSYTAAKITTADKAKFDMSLKLARVAMVELNMAPSGRLLILKQVETNYGLPATLPNYTEDNNGSANGSMETASLTTLLHDFEATVSAQKANATLIGLGFLKESTRPSTKTPSKIVAFKVIDGGGLKYGKNLTNPSNPRETQPHWYRDTFGELLTLIVDKSKNAA